MKDIRELDEKELDSVDGGVFVAPIDVGTAPDFDRLCSVVVDDGYAFEEVLADGTVHYMNRDGVDIFTKTF